MRFDCKYAIFDSDGTLLDSMRYWRLTPLEYMIANDMEIPEQMTRSEASRLLDRWIAVHGRMPRD